MGNAGFMFNKCVGTVRLMFLESGVYLWGMWGLCLGKVGLRNTVGTVRLMFSESGVIGNVRSLYGECGAYIWGMWGLYRGNVGFMYGECGVYVWGMWGLCRGDVGLMYGDILSFRCSWKKRCWNLWGKSPLKMNRLLEHSPTPPHNIQTIIN